MKRVNWAVLAAVMFCVAAGPAATRPGALPQLPRPKRVVYLIDGSGSMMNIFQDVREDVANRLKALGGSDAFNVLIYSEEQVWAASKTIQAATPAAVEKATKFLKDRMPHGSGADVAAIRAAFEQAPDEVWLITDGEFQEWRAVSAEVAARHRARRATVNTTLKYAGHQTSFEDRLIALSRMTGGVCLDRDGAPVPASRAVEPEPKPQPPAKPSSPKPAPKPPVEEGVRLK